MARYGVARQRGSMRPMLLVLGGVLLGVVAATLFQTAALVHPSADVHARACSALSPREDAQRQPRETCPCSLDCRGANSAATICL